MVEDNTANEKNGEEKDTPASEKEKDAAEKEFEEREADLSKLEDPEFLLEEAKKELAEQRQNYLRALADLENFKKRATKERSELLKYQGEKILYDLLDVLDNLDLALSQEETTLEELQTGLKMIQTLFIDTLDKWGIKGESGVGKPFNPDIQEALSMIEDPDSEPGMVIQELKKAYYYKDRVLRTAQVIVAKEAEEEPENEPEEQKEEE